MKLTRRAVLDEVVAAWVQAEVDSPFFRGHYPELGEADRQLIDRPDVHDPAENSLRRILLSCRDGILATISEGAEWWAAELGQEDLAGLLSSSYPSWEEYSSGTGRLLRVAEAIRRGVLPAVPDPQVQKGIVAIYRPVGGIFGELAAGENTRPLILLARAVAGPFTVIEETNRATALCWRHCLDGIPCPVLAAFVGITPHSNPWLSPHAAA